MKKLLFLLLGIVIITTACQTNTELTDADKDAIVQAVKQTSQEYWAAISQTYDIESYSKVRKYFDEDSDQIWQSDPIALILNTGIINKQADWQIQLETMIGNRISTPVNVSEVYYTTLSDKKVFEVIKGEFSYMRKDSSVVGPITFVGTSIWANINGEWKLQFVHQVNE